MEPYESNITLDHAAKLLGEAKRALVTCHAKPDGDAFGAVVAVSQAIRQLGNVADAVLVPPIPHEFRSLAGIEQCMEYGKFKPSETYDLLVILDTGAWSQLVPMQADLTRHLDHCLIIDHHTTGDVAAQWRYVDTKAAATCQIVADLLTSMPQPAEGSFLQCPAIRQALFIGIATDTGWFRFSNTSPQTLRWARKLLEAGVSQADLYQKVEQSARPAKLLLMARALANCRLIGDGRGAIMTLSSQDFEYAGAGAEDTDRLVDLPQVVGQVQLVALISDPPNTMSQEGENPPLVSVSFRSKPGPHAIDVAHLARQFGGGGHHRAAGAKVAGSIEQVTEQVADAMEAALANHEQSAGL